MRQPIMRASSSSRWFDRQQPQLVRVSDRLGPIVRLQFAQDVIDVALHRADADHQRSSNLLVRRALSDQLQHLPLAFAQRLHECNLVILKREW